MKILEKLKAKQMDKHANKSVTIAFLGDSVTQGCFDVYYDRAGRIQTFFDYKKAYSTRVRELLNLLYPEAQINVINSGISGDTAGGGAKRVERDVLAFNPDLVVISYGLNDVTESDEGLTNYKNALAEIFEKVIKSGAECIFMTQNYYNTNISDHLIPEALELAEVLERKQKSGMLKNYYQNAMALARKMGVKVCDVYRKWEAMEKGGVNTTELLANKLNHPIPELHYLFAYSLIETMFELD